MARIDVVKLSLFAVMITVTSSCMFGLRGGGPGAHVEFMVNGPPRDRVEEIPVSPGAEYVWIGGNWTRNGSDYAWTSGHYERPAAGYHSWVAGHWDHEARGYFFVAGHWA